jgi:transposase
MVCMRLPHESRAGRRTRKVREVTAAFAAVVALMDHLVCQGAGRLVLESASGYWRIWYYLAEAAGMEVWLVSARDVRHLPGRPGSGRLGCVWLCKLNERGMLRRSFVPPEPVRDLRALTRLRASLTHDRVRHQNRIEKILEDALLKVSSVISDLMGGSGRRFLQALADGERSPAALAALGDYRLHASKAGLQGALTGRFRDIHGFGIGMLGKLIDDRVIEPHRVPCSMNTSTYSRVSSTVSACRKSTARIPAAWACGNCRHVGPERRGAGSMPAARRIS